MRMYWNNMLDTAGLTSSSIKDGTSLSNVFHKHLSKRFSFNDNFGYLDIDFGVPVSFNKILIGGSNCTDSITISGSDTPQAITPLSTITLELNGDTWGSSVDEEFRYWRIDFSDSSLTYLWVGYIFIGDYMQMPGIDPSYVLNYNTTSASTMSVSLQPYGDKGIQNFSSAFNFPFIADIVLQNPAGIDIATRADILEMWYEVESYTPFYMEIAENSLDVIPPMLGIFAQGSMSFALHQTQAHYSLGFAFQETK